jgi:hypothetical protein
MLLRARCRSCAGRAERGGWAVTGNGVSRVTARASPPLLIFNRARCSPDGSQCRLRDVAARHLVLAGSAGCKVQLTFGPCSGSTFKITLGGGAVHITPRSSTIWSAELSRKCADRSALVTDLGEAFV